MNKPKGNFFQFVFKVQKKFTFTKKSRAFVFKRAFDTEMPWDAI